MPGRSTESLGVNWSGEISVVARGFVIGAAVGVLAVGAIGMFGVRGVAVLGVAALVYGFVLWGLGAMFADFLQLGPDAVNTLESAFPDNYLTFAILTTVLLAAFAGAAIGILVAVFRRLRDMGVNN